jgi:hypothetical protein
MTFLIGDVCTSVFDSRPMSLLPASGALTIQLNQFVEIIDSCYTNGSLIDIIQSTGLVSSGMLNISGLASAQLDTLDFSSVSDFDIK